MNIKLSNAHCAIGVTSFGTSGSGSLYVQGYGPSWPDQQQDITTQTTRLSNGVLRAVFSRPILAGEIGVDKTLTGCTTWNFITGIGMAYETHVSKHTRHPETRTICLVKFSQITLHIYY